MPSAKTMQDLVGYRNLITAEPQFERLRIGYKNKHIDIAEKDVFIGIEVEVENVLSTSHVRRVEVAGNSVFLWNNIEDGSLRNNGREFVSIPVRGDNIPFALDTLHNFLHKNSDCTGHEFSPRTSVHVHVDARDFTFEQVNNMLLLYMAVEPMLYNFCGGNRHKNIYCVPLNQTDLESFIHKTIKFGSNQENQVFEYYRAWKKYTGFNLKPLHNQGTIEFRHMVGTIDVDKLLLWINLLLKLRAFAKSNSFAHIKETIVNLNTSSEYIMLLHRIFGDYADALMMAQIDSKMEEMVIFIKDCLSNTPDTSHLMAELLVNGDINEETKLFKHALESKLISLRSKPKPKKVRTDLPQAAPFEINVLGNIDEQWIRAARNAEFVAPRRRDGIRLEVDEDPLDF